MLFALQPILRDELVRNRDAVAALYMVDVIAAGDTLGADAGLRLIAQAEAWAKEALGFGGLLLGTFGLLDLLWIGLGISTAWKLGQGIG